METKTAKRRASLVSDGPKPVAPNKAAGLFDAGNIQNPFDSFLNQTGVAPASQVLNPTASPSAPGVPPRGGANPGDAMQLKKDLMFGRHVGWGHDNMTPADKWAGMFTPAADRAGLQTTAPTTDAMRAAGPELMAATHAPAPSHAPLTFPQSPELANAMRPPGTPGMYGEPGDNPGYAMQGKMPPGRAIPGVDYTQYKGGVVPGVDYTPPTLTGPQSATGSVRYEGPASGSAEATLAGPPVGSKQPLGQPLPVGGAAGATVPQSAYPVQAARYLRQFLRF